LIKWKLHQQIHFKIISDHKDEKMITKMPQISHSYHTVTKIILAKFSDTQYICKM